MKIFILLFTFLISISSALASTEEYLDFDPLTEDVIRTFSNELAGRYEILDQTSDVTKASFDIEVVSPQEILVSNFIMYGQENDSLLAIFNILKKNEIKTEGSDSGFYFSDLMYDEDFFKEYGFTRLEDTAVPSFLRERLGTNIYVRNKKITVTITEKDGREEDIEI